MEGAATGEQIVAVELAEPTLRKDAFKEAVDPDTMRAGGGNRADKAAVRGGGGPGAAANAEHVADLGGAEKLLTVPRSPEESSDDFCCNGIVVIDATTAGTGDPSTTDRAAQ
mmetsp:Transcript_78228/g.226175  ORF Transcript_78228/g.226175 Transcript_78228/m.226175 type:complete len:112 (+) Transcript_78228:722-1057(+)